MNDKEKEQAKKKKKWQNDITINRIIFCCSQTQRTDIDYLQRRKYRNRIVKLVDDLNFGDDI
jgi:hypothetical protein